MKKLFYLFSIIAISVAFAACSSDSAPSDMPSTLKDSATKTAQMVSAENASTISASDIVFTIDDYAQVAKFSKWIKKGSAHTDSRISFVGLPKEEGFELTNIVLELDKGSKNKPRFTINKITEDKEITDASYFVFLSEVADEVAKKGRATIKVGAHSNKALNANIKIKLDINFDLK